MATVTTKQCDVYGTTKPEIHRYRVTITLLPGDNLPAQKPVYEKEADLSGRAMERLVRWIDKGMSPPRQRGEGSPKPAKDVPGQVVSEDLAGKAETSSDE